MHDDSQRSQSKMIFNPQTPPREARPLLAPPAPVKGPATDQPATDQATTTQATTEQAAVAQATAAQPRVEKSLFEEFEEERDH